MDPEKLLLDLSSGHELSDGQLDEVVEVLELALLDNHLRKPSVDDLYSLLVVLGKAGAEEKRSIVEKYLDFEDPLTAAKALEILCLDWKATDDYIERVINFAVGVNWDYDEDVKQVAIKILGEFLSELNSKPGGLEIKKAQVLEFLLSVFHEKKHEVWTRKTAYCALCRAGGKSNEELPAECKMLDMSAGSNDIDWEMINYLNSLLSERSAKASSSSSGSAGRPGIQ